MNKRRDSIAIPLLILIVFLAIVCLVAHCASDAQAEWIRVPEFGGAVSSVTPSEIGIQYSRLLSGWYLEDGDLMQLYIEKRDTLTSAALAQGIKFLAPYESNDELLYSKGGVLYAYAISIDASTQLSVLTIDTCSTVADSDVVYYNGADVGVSHWLNMVLSEITPSQRSAINIGGVYYETQMFLSDTAVRMVEEQSASATDTINWHVGFSGSASRPMYYFIHGDTTTILDGANRTSYNGLSVGGVKWPLYSDSGSYDSMGTDWYGDNGQAIGDSLVIYGDFDDYTGGFFLWSDNTDSAHAIPFQIAAHLSDGVAGEEHILLVGDTSAFKRSDADDSLYTAHFHNTSQRYLIYSHGLGDYDSTGSYFLTDLLPPGAAIGDYAGIDTVTILDDGTYVFRAHIGSNAPSWMYDINALDAAIYRIEAGGYRHSGLESYSVRIEQVFGLDSLYLLYWGRGTAGYTSKVRWTTSDKAVSLRLHRLPAVPFEPTDQQTALAYDICISSPHRDRAWYAKDRVVAYSDLNDWYDIAGGGTVTFQKDVTALSSFGNEMVAHLGGNEIQVWTGYAEADFYKVPAPAGVSAMNQASLVYCDRDNADYFPHPLGLWKYAGGGVAEVPLASREIFTDSINWEASEQLVGAIYDDKYWLGYPQKPSTTNNRLAVFDLEAGDVTFVGRIHPGSFYVRTDPAIGQQLWIGDADSAVIWLANSGTNEVPPSSEMRSGWYFGDDRSQRKLVREYTVGYSGVIGDTLIVDFYTGGEGATWSDTISVPSGGREVFGDITSGGSNLSWLSGDAKGGVFTPTKTGFLDSAYAYFSAGNLDGAEELIIKVALYQRRGADYATFVDSCYARTFTVSDIPITGRYGFEFSSDDTRVIKGVSYFILLRANEDNDVQFTLQYDADASETRVEADNYDLFSITTPWISALASPGPWSFTETDGSSIAISVTYSATEVQQHYAAVPRLVQGTAISYGLRSPSPTMRVIDFAADIVPLGRERSR